ncbi:MAG TPA: hypothetical protein VFG84_00025, partial [Gemmatimonadaceae bacterium]|nr:hypothetical protein [Gemmatimonadaceae bacterium]
MPFLANGRWRIALLCSFVLGVLVAPPAVRTLTAQAPGAVAQVQAPDAGGGGEANLVIPDLSQVSFLGVPGHTLLYSGLFVSALGLLFGLAIYSQLRNLPVHASMLEISELIYETCKTYL